LIQDNLAVEIDLETHDDDAQLHFQALHFGFIARNVTTPVSGRPRTMSLRLRDLSMIVKLLATGSSNDYFGLCPICLNKEVAFLTIGSNLYFVCHEHKLHWLDVAKEFSSALGLQDGIEDDDAQKNRELIASYTAVVPWLRPRWAWQLEFRTRPIRNLIERATGCFTARGQKKAENRRTLPYR
jgi:hypothetical protein